MMVFAWIQHCVFVWTCRRSTHIHKKRPFLTYFCATATTWVKYSSFTHTTACQYWFLSKYMSRLEICKNKQTYAKVHTHTHTAVCQERRVMRRLNKHSHQLMGAWVIEKASKWDKEWRHKRERREGERYGDEGAMSRLWWWRVRATGEIRSKSDKGNKL